MTIDYLATDASMPPRPPWSPTLIPSPRPPATPSMPAPGESAHLNRLPTRHRRTLLLRDSTRHAQRVFPAVTVRPTNLGPSRTTDPINDQPTHDPDGRTRHLSPAGRPPRTPSTRHGRVQTRPRQHPPAA
ncbi:hypothetical protein PMIN06_001233 [Paraphaeosphaeria minitans]